MICWNVPVISKRHCIGISEADDIDVGPFFFIWDYIALTLRGFIVLDAGAAICQLSEIRGG